VAQKLIASSADLDAIAAGRRDVPALRGWRGSFSATTRCGSAAASWR
jgi:hypothetical protein